MAGSSTSRPRRARRATIRCMLVVGSVAALLVVSVAPGKTISFAFRATITGIFEIELEDAGEPIAELRVDP